MAPTTRGRGPSDSSSRSLSPIGNPGKLRSALSPSRHLPNPISKLGRYAKSRANSISSPTNETSVKKIQDIEDDDLAKSKYMMKSIVGLLTTASMYAGMDDAQEADELAQHIVPDDEEEEEIGKNKPKGSGGQSDEVAVYKEPGKDQKTKPEKVPLPLSPAVRKPTLFSFSVVPTDDLDSDSTADSSKLTGRRKIITQLLSHFKLDPSETLLKEYFAWLLKDVLVQGKLLITSKHILFFAYLPKSPGTVKLSGNLNIRSTLRASSRYWCVLKDHTLTLYTSPTEVYFPVLTIDLRSVTSVRIDKLSSTDGSQKTFKVSSNERTYVFTADTDYSARTWCNALKKQQFAEQNSDNDSVSLKIPLANVIDIDDQTIVKQALTVRIRALESTSSYAIDDFHFVFLDGTGFTLMKVVKDQISALSDAGMRILFDNVVIDDQRSRSPTVKSADGSDADNGARGASPVTKGERFSSHELFIDRALQRPAGSDAKDTGEISWRRRIREISGNWLLAKPPAIDSAEDTVVEYYSKSSSLGANGSPQANLGDQISDDDISEETSRESRRAKLAGWTTKPFKNVAEMWSGHPMHYANDFIPFSEDDPYLVKDKHKLAAIHRFQRHFKLTNDECLISSSFTYLTRNIPLYGKLYIANSVMCFRTLLPTVNTKMILPLSDIETCYKEKGFRFGYLGLVVVIRGHEELFFEFSTALARDDAEYILLKQLDEFKPKSKLPLVATTNILETDIDNAKLKFFEDKINAEGFEVPLLFDESPFFKTKIKPTRSYKIGILTIGSRGDVQPYIALGKGLIKEGHQVTIITHGEFHSFVTSHGINFEEIAGDPAELMALMVEHESMNVSLLRDASSRFRGWITSLLDTSWVACKSLQLDILIESPSAMAGIHIAEALEIPYFRAFTMPWTRTRAYPHAFIVPDQKRGGNYNYLTHVLFENLFWKGISGQVNKWRLESLGLNRTNLDMLQQGKVPFFYNVSPTVFSPSVDFSEWIKVTGYWFLDEKHTYEPPQELADFINKAKKLNKKLVYIGFGSIVVSNAKEMTKAICKAVTDADVYCILNKGWSERLNDKTCTQVEVPLPECVFNAGNVPHDWLFPQMDAAVHHGGSGTTGATLRAGLPTVVKPFFGDQFFYALRVEDIGAGVALKKLNSSSLAHALKEVTTNKRMLDKAQLIKRQIAVEDGVQTAINCLYGELEYARSLVVSKRRRSKVETTNMGKAQSKADVEKGREGWTLV
ncbi:hypothetical protein HG536_0B00870 [Torulaspora globosa]|uniref:Sterol 3-beta-glucosyltransferase n=1 Tax=Torulaspora globosa TaxID=48254 RepID=A0A7G3ZCJ0_9SACH|nr:uncharacterized protein HG536_0B00870 [Torulaspora globosa]QLL31226.1 hypothetical protein HG536_0B00870 [Torulaspora globosa]